jgi:hypothetical protein
LVMILCVGRDDECVESQFQKLNNFDRKPSIFPLFFEAL